MKTESVAVLIVLCVAILTSCSRDPRSIVVGKEHGDDFPKLVQDSKGLTPEDLALLKGAEARIGKTLALDQVVGKTIGAIITVQKQWQAAHDQLVNKLEPVYRAGKTIQSSTGVGVTLIKYGELVQAFAAELNIAGDKLSTDDERAVAALFKSALLAYHDAGAIWQRSVENARFEETFPGGILYTLQKPPPDSEIKRIVDTYNLPVLDAKVRYLGTLYQFMPKSSVQMIWAAASAKLDEAVRGYASR
jgi:hypothetical protein